MDSTTYIVFTVQIYHGVVICKANNTVYGMSEKESFKTSFDEAVRYLSKNSARTFLRMNPKQGLEQIIETGLTLTSTLQQRRQDNVFLFTDLNRGTNGIIKEVLEFQTTRFQNANMVHIDSTLDLQEKV